jgi:hypothetical protein
MSDQRIVRAFQHADALVNRACGALEALRATYALSSLPRDQQIARMDALNAKIDYLRGLPLNGEAYPWTEDDFGGAS